MMKVLKNISLESFFQKNIPDEQKLKILMHTNITIQHFIDIQQSFLEENKKRGHGILVWPVCILHYLYEQGGFRKLFSGFYQHLIKIMQDSEY